MTIFTVTVTYGNRFHLLKQVIDSALAEGVTKVIVVDNNSEAENREQLQAYEQELESVLIIQQLMRLLWNLQVWMLQLWLKVFAYESNLPIHEYWEKYD